MLDAPVLGEIEQGLLVVGAFVQVADRGDQLVAFGLRQRDDLARGRDHGAAADQVAAFLEARLGDADHPDRILVGAGLHREVVVEAREVLVDPDPGQHRGRVVAEHDELRPLEREHPISLGPAPVVADAHPHHAVQGAPGAEAQVADLEVELLEMLKRILRAVVGVAREMDLAVLADDRARLVDEDGGVVAALDAALLDELRVAQVEADTEALGLVKERPGRGIGHLALEEGVELVLVLDPPARKKTGQRKLRKYHQVAAPVVRRAKELDQARDHRLAALVPRDRAELRPAHRHLAAHRRPPPDLGDSIAPTPMP